MGKIVSSVGNILGVGGNDHGPGPQLNKQPFDISKESDEYKQYFDSQRKEAEARTAAANTPALIAHLSQQALGQGPSLAEAQLKSATNRNLAQQLSLAATQRGRNPAAVGRQIFAEQGAAGRSLADQAAQARMQEATQAQNQLFQQQNAADTLAAQSAQSGFQTAVAPKTAMQNYETQRFGADVAKTNANKAQQSSILGGVLGAAGTLGAAYMTGGASLAAGGLRQPPPGTNDAFDSTMLRTGYDGGRAKDIPAGGRVKSRMVSHLADGGRAEGDEDAEPTTNEEARAALLKHLVEDKANNMNTYTPHPTESPRAKELREGGIERVPQKAQGGRMDAAPAEQAVAPGNDLANDKIPAMLSEDEIVIPRTHSMDQKKATSFVQALFAKEKSEGTGAEKVNYDTVAKARKRNFKKAE